MRGGEGEFNHLRFKTLFNGNLIGFTIFHINNSTIYNCMKYILYILQIYYGVYVI